MTDKKRLTKKELEAGLASGQITYKDPKAKHRKGYEVRIASGFEVSDSYPSFNDHPSQVGTIEYAKNVDTSPLATVWEAIANEHYAQGGIPLWIHNLTSSLDLAIYWQIAHYQRVWEGRANMSLKTLSRNQGVKYRSVQRSIRKLLDIGAIELIQKNSGRRPAAYRVVLLSSLEQPLDVEATSEIVETTNEHRRGDSSVVQKTKPLKGRVVGAPPEAGRDTPRKKKSSPLRTIDEDRTFRAKQRAKQKKSLRPSLVRAFFLAEVRKEKIEEALGIELLAKKWKAALNLAKVSGGVDLENDSFTPAPEVNEEIFLEKVQKILTLNKFDVTKLERALDSVLDSILQEMELKKKEFEETLKNFRDQRERESRLQAVKEKEEAARLEKIEREEAERLQKRKKSHGEEVEYLERARNLLRALYPDLQNRIDGWGSVRGFLYELNGGKEYGRIENAEVRSLLYEVSTAIPKKLLELERARGNTAALADSSLDCWINGGEEWRAKVFFPE